MKRSIKGLGTELYRRLIELAREEKLGKLISNMLPENREMRAHVHQARVPDVLQPGGQHDPRRVGAIARAKQEIEVSPFDSNLWEFR